MARFLARWWYVDHGAPIVPSKLQSLLGDMLPQQLLGGVLAKTRDSWTQAIIAAFEKMGLAANKYTKTQVGLHYVLSSNSRSSDRQRDFLSVRRCVSQ